MPTATFERMPYCTGDWQTCYDYLSRAFNSIPEHQEASWSVDGFQRRTDAKMFDALAEDASALRLYIGGK